MTTCRYLTLKRLSEWMAQSGFFPSAGNILTCLAAGSGEEGGESQLPKQRDGTRPGSYRSGAMAGKSQTEF